jgi:NADPH2 dehydrogenase
VNDNKRHFNIFEQHTRFRTDEDQNILPFVKDYYAQRASTPGTLLISEAVIPSRLPGSITHMPEIWSDAQIAAWKDVVDAVHEKRCYMFLQICGNGRAASLSERAKDGLDLIGPSAIPIGADPEGSGVVSTGDDNPIPREMTEDEIWQVIADIAQAGKNGVEKCGFDGIEINACNGHMLDQFIQDNSNRRTDAWGGSIKKRSRFVIEVAKAVIAAVGKEKVGFRFSPFSTYLSMRMADPVPQFTYLIKELSALGVAYIHLIEPRIAGDSLVEMGHADSLIPFLDAWGERPVIIAGGYSAESVLKAVGAGGVYEWRKVAIAFGRHYVSNPDLVFKVKNGVPLAPYDRKTFYEIGSEKGFTDYEFSEEYKAQAGM